MSEARVIYFTEISAPVLLDDAPELLDAISAIMPGWPYAVETSAHADKPFFSVRRGPKKGRYFCHKFDEPEKPRALDTVNAVCDLVAAASHALPQSKGNLLCLHSAALDFGGRLVVFPNTRRAGKSTLTACLAHEGYPVFTDDFLPVTSDIEGRVIGRANGVSPRLRLPLPAHCSEDFAEWVDTNPGPRNAQYKYLTLANLPDNGQTLPLGAIVFLNRQESGPATLSEIGPAEAMERLLYQNFARELHSWVILEIVKAMLESLPLQVLTYASVHDAAQCLGAAFSDWPGETPANEQLATLEFRPAVFEEELARAKLTPNRLCQRNDGVFVTSVGDATYMSDPLGRGIYHANPTTQAIWEALQEPNTPADIVSAFQDAFPEEKPDQIEADVSAVIAKLLRSGLISHL